MSVLDKAKKRKQGFTTESKPTVTVTPVKDTAAEKKIKQLEKKLAAMGQSSNRKPYELKTAPRTFTIANGAFEEFRDYCKSNDLSMSKVLSDFMISTAKK